MVILPCTSVHGLFAICRLLDLSKALAGRAMLTELPGDLILSAEFACNSMRCSKAAASHLGVGLVSIRTRSAKSTTKLNEQVQHTVERLMHGRTVIAVAHCLSTVAGFDRILVRVEGRIVKDGPPNTLRV
jgi:hypothetical protein